MEGGQGDPFAAGDPPRDCVCSAGAVFAQIKRLQPPIWAHP